MDKIYEIKRKILYKEVASIFRELEKINYAVIKGEALSMQIYGKPNKRHSGDIDILVGKSDIVRVENLLQNNGFMQLKNKKLNEREKRILCFLYSHQIPSYYKIKYNLILNIDVNFDIYWGEYDGKRIYMKNFLQNEERLYIYGQNLKVLSKEKAFVQLILHHYKEMNSIYHLLQYNCIRTNYFSDIRDFIIYNRDIFTEEKVSNIGEKYNIKEYIYYMLYYIKRIFKEKSWNKYIEYVECDKGKRIIETLGLNGNERKNWTIPFEKRLNNDRLHDEVINLVNKNDLQKYRIEQEIFG